MIMTCWATSIKKISFYWYILIDKSFSKQTNGQKINKNKNQQQERKV